MLGTAIGAIVLVVGLIVAYKLPLLKNSTNDTNSDDVNIATVSPSVTSSATPLVTTTPPASSQSETSWYSREGNFLRYAVGTSDIVPIPVVFLLAKDYTLTSSTLGDVCMQQKIHNGNDATGVIGNFSLVFKQSCSAAITTGRLPAGWVDIGQIFHLADDGSEIHFVRIAGTTMNTYKYVQVLIKAGQSIKTGDIYNDYSLVYPNNNIGDANTAVLISSIQLTTAPKDQNEKYTHLKYADKMVLSVYVAK
jgi:hypothetical protein